MKNPKIHVKFDENILQVRFDDHAEINAKDLAAIYDFANRQSNNIPYCVLFEASNHYEVTDDALEYMSDNPNNKNILAKVYIVNHKEAEVKTRLHLLFDNPVLKPFVFRSYDEGMEYLRDRLGSNRQSSVGSRQ